MITTAGGSPSLWKRVVPSYPQHTKARHYGLPPSSRASSRPLGDKHGGQSPPAAKWEIDDEGGVIFDAAEISRITGGELVFHSETSGSICTDRLVCLAHTLNLVGPLFFYTKLIIIRLPTTLCSRALCAGQWFLALIGDNFDGNAFLDDAKR